MRITAATVIALSVFLVASSQLAASGANDSLVIMVRHAEKAKDDPRDPTLSEQGQQRAQALSDTLSDSLPVAVFASPYRRTQLTAAPIAALANVKVTIIPIEGDAKQYAIDVAAAIAKVSEPGPILVVGHSNTIPPLIAALGGSEPNIGETDYDNLFMLRHPGGDRVDLIHAHYGLAD